MADASARKPRRASLRLNAAASALGNLTFFAVVFLITPIAVRELGEQGWGIWQLVNATTAYSALFNLGLGTAIHYQVAFNVARSDWDRLAEAFTNARVYLSGAGLVLLLLLWLLGRPFVESLVDAQWADLAHSALLLTVGLTAVTLPMRLYPSSLAGLQRLDLYGIIHTSSAIVLFAMVWFGLSRGIGLAGFALLMTLGTLLPTAPSWLLVHILLPRASLRWTRVSWPVFLELFRYSLSTLLYGMGAVVLYQTMKFVAAWRCGGPEAAGWMGFAVSLVQALGVVFVPILNTLHARFGQLHGEGRSDAIRSLLERSMVVTGALLIPSIVFLVLDARLIYEAWLGNAVAPATLDVLARTSRLMFLGQGAYVLALPCYYALLGVGRHRVFGVGMLVTATANAVIGWLAAGAWPRIETLGAVFGVLVTALAFLVTIPAALRQLPVSIGMVLRRGILVPAVASAAPGAAAIQARPRLGSPLLDLAIDAALFSLVALPGLEWTRRQQRVGSAGGSP